MAKKVTTAAEVEQAAKEIQKEHAITAPEEPPLTGVEIAARIGANQPPPPPAGTQYHMRDLTDPDAKSVTVTSPDGSIEDAVRAFNANRKEIRTAKQLSISKVSA